MWHLMKYLELIIYHLIHVLVAHKPTYQKLLIDSIKEKCSNNFVCLKRVFLSHAVIQSGSNFYYCRANMLLGAYFTREKNGS